MMNGAIAEDQVLDHGKQWTWQDTDLNSAEMDIIAASSVKFIFIAYTFYISTVIIAAIVYIL